MVRLLGSFMPKWYLNSQVYWKNAPNSQNIELTQLHINAWMEKDNLISILHNGMPFNFYSEGNPIICDNVDESGVHFVKCLSQIQKINPAQ